MISLYLQWHLPLSLCYLQNPSIGAFGFYLAFFLHHFTYFRVFGYTENPYIKFLVNLFRQRLCKFMNIDHEVFTGVYSLGQGFTPLPLWLQKSPNVPLWVIQLVSEEPEIQSPLLCEVWLKLKCHSPTSTDLDFCGPLIVHLNWTAPQKEDQGIQAWFPQGGSGCALVVPTYAAWYTWCYMQCKLLFLWCKILI